MVRIAGNGIAPTVDDQLAAVLATQGLPVPYLIEKLGFINNYKNHKEAVAVPRSRSATERWLTITSVGGGAVPLPTM